MYRIENDSIVILISDDSDSDDVQEITEETLEEKIKRILPDYDSVQPLLEIDDGNAVLGVTADDNIWNELEETEVSNSCKYSKNRLYFVNKKDDTKKPEADKYVHQNEDTEKIDNKEEEHDKVEKGNKEKENNEEEQDNVEEGNKGKDNNEEEEQDNVEESNKGKENNEEKQGNAEEGNKGKQKILFIFTNSKKEKEYKEQEVNEEVDDKDDKVGIDVYHHLKIEIDDELIIADNTNEKKYAGLFKNKKDVKY